MRRLVVLVLLLSLAVGLVACANVKSEVERLDAADVARGTAAVRYIAHRGHCVVMDSEGVIIVGENTEASFRNAASIATFWGIETDVWQTKDGVLVCMHDKDAVEGIDDVHEAIGAEVLSRPLKKAAGYCAPTFQTYLDVCQAGGKVAVVEIKDAAMSESCMDDVLSAIDKSGVRAVVISFHLDKLEYVRAHNKTIECMLLYHSGWKKNYRKDVGGSIGKEAYLERLIDKRIGLSVDCEYLYKHRDEGWVDRFHQAGLTVGVWTVDDIYHAIYDAAALGVDYITSNLDMGALVAAKLQ